MLAARPNSNASRFNGLDFSSEVGPKSFHQLAHPSDEVGSLHGFEQLRGKVVGLKMKDAIPTPAERLDIRRRQERVDPGINQLQIPEALNNDGQARVPKDVAQTFIFDTARFMESAKKSGVKPRVSQT